MLLIEFFLWIPCYFYKKSNLTLGFASRKASEKSDESIPINYGDGIVVQTMVELEIFKTPEQVSLIWKYQKNCTEIPDTWGTSADFNREERAKDDLY
jgi:hypothetical protein